MKLKSIKDKVKAKQNQSQNKNPKPITKNQVILAAILLVIEGIIIYWTLDITGCLNPLTWWFGFIWFVFAGSLYIDIRDWDENNQNTGNSSNNKGDDKHDDS